MAHVLPGVYVTFTGPVDDLCRWQAAAVYGGEGAALTGVPALRLANLTTSRVEAVPLLIPHERRRRSVPGVVVLRTLRMPPVREIAGLPVAGPVRALADACRLTREITAARALVTEGLRSSNVSVAALRRELTEGPRRGSALLREVLDEYADGIRSVAEAEARRKLILLPIPTPLFNPDLYTTDGSFLCRPDAYWPDAGLAFEVDSMRYHGDMVTWERTQRRHGSMTAHDLAILHASPLRVRTDWPRLGAEVVQAYHFGLRRGAPNIRVIPAA